MAKAASKSDKPAKKDKKTKGDASAPLRAKPKADKNSKKKKSASARPGPRSERHSTLESLAKLADHPMIADLLAAGAVAAVAAIAEHQLDKNRPASSKMVKSAGKAAAAAIGKKLMGEFGAITDAAANAAKKA